MNESPLTLFIPFGSGYGNPGLTLRAENVGELNAVLSDLSEPTDVTDPESASKRDELLDGVLTVKAGVLLKFPQDEKPKAAPTVTHPQAATSAPADAPVCTHGPMKWKEGVSKSGNNYKGWFCGAPYGQTQCKAQFVK
jgi:hypothetical protein